MTEDADWLPVPGTAVVLVHIAMGQLWISRTEHPVVRGRTEQGRLVQVPLEWLDGESQRQVRAALEEGRES